MKKYFYAIMAVAALAITLAGCTDGGGGYWPATPGIQVTGTNVSPLGGGNNAAAVLFNVPTNGTPVALQNINTALVGGCPILGLSTTTGIGQMFGSVKALPGVRAAGVSKKKTETGFTVASTDTSASKQTDNFYKFTYSYKTTAYVSSSGSSSSSSGQTSAQPACNILPSYSSYDSYSSTAVTKTYSWELYVQLISSKSENITITSDDTTWFSYATAPDKIYFYGNYTMSMEGTGYNWKEVTKFGDSVDYWKIENLDSATSTNPQKIRGTATTTSSGELDKKETTSFSYSYAISDGSTGYFTYPTSGSPTGVIKFGNSDLYITITFSGGTTATISYSPSAPAGAPTSITL